MRLGAYVAELEPGSQVAEAYGATVVSERHRHRYEFNPRYRHQLRGHDAALSGESPDDRLVEFIELDDHPFWVGTQAHPEFKSRPTGPAPLFRELRRRRPGAGRGPQPRTCSTERLPVPPTTPVDARRPEPWPASGSWARSRSASGHRLRRRHRSTFEAPDGVDLRARRASAPGRSWPSCRCSTTATPSCCVRQYRAALDDLLLEIPAGMCRREGEDAEAYARRELVEEVGYRAADARPALPGYDWPPGSATSSSPCSWPPA